MARKDRNSEAWYIGSITNEDPRTLEINLAFLEDSVDYRAEIYADGEHAGYKNNPDPVTISTRVVNSKTQLNLELAAGGGTAIRLVPMR
jgi:alpha-glucosidase